jgi:hypothetical protein
VFEVLGRKVPLLLSTGKASRKTRVEAHVLAGGARPLAHLQEVVEGGDLVLGSGSAEDDFA